MSISSRHVYMFDQSRSPRQDLFRHLSRSAEDGSMTVPQVDRVDGVLSELVAVIPATRSQCCVPSKRCVASSTVALASNPDVPRSMLQGRFRNMKRAAAASKVTRLAARFANRPISHPHQ